MKRYRYFQLAALLVILVMTTVWAADIWTANPTREYLRNGWQTLYWAGSVTADDTTTSSYFTIPIERDTYLYNSFLRAYLTVTADTFSTRAAVYLYGAHNTTSTGTLVDTLFAIQDSVKTIAAAYKVDLMNSELFPYYYWKVCVDSTVKALPLKTTSWTIKLW